MKLFVQARVFDFISDIKDELSTIGNKLIPNFYSFIVQLLSLIVVIVFVIILLYKPIKKNLNKRNDFVVSQIEEAKQDKIKANNSLTEANNNLVESRKKSVEIISNATLLAESKKAEIILEGEKEVEKMKEEALKDIELAKQEANKQIHNSIADIAIKTSEAILKREVNEEDNSSLIDDFIKDIE